MSNDPLAPLMQISAISQQVARSRETVDAVLGHRVVKRRPAEVSAESLLRGAWASAVLAGSAATMADVRAAGAASGPDVSGPDDFGPETGAAAVAQLDPVLRGALRVSAELRALADPWRSAHRQVLARLHALAAADLVESDDELGRPRPDREVVHRLDILADVLGETKAPAVVVAAVVQAEILSLDAFAPASGVVGRAAARLTLIERGLDPRSLVALEVGHLALRAEMAEALDAYRAGDEAGVVTWITHCCQALEMGARESLSICEELQRG
ncbi:oxidoreductase [Jatrophihabitans sp. DSM 45814]